MERSESDRQSRAFKISPFYKKQQLVLAEHTKAGAGRGR